MSDRRVSGTASAPRSPATRTLPSIRSSRPSARSDADHLDRVQRDAVGAGEDRVDDGLGQAGHETGEQLAHRIIVEGIDGHAGDVSQPGAPIGPPVEQLRPSEGDDEDRGRLGPAKQVVDEVEQARVGPVEILEQHDRRRLVGDAFEQDPPGGEQDIPPTGRRWLEAEQGEEGGLDPAAVRLVGDELADHLGDPGAGGGIVVGLRQPGPLADHLAEGPEGHAVAIGRRPALMPEDALDDAVDVLLELPREATLADARRAGHRDEPRPAIAAGRVEELLEGSELVRPADERRFDRVGSPLRRLARR